MDATQPRKVHVRRVTVDERLAGDLIRLLICELAPGVIEFYDRSGDWSREREVWARPHTYAHYLGLSSSLVHEWPWEKLQEGQVFLSGEFEIIGDRRRPAYFRIRPGAVEFIRLDNLREFKDGVIRTYSDLLRR